MRPDLAIFLTTTAAAAVVDAAMSCDQYDNSGWAVRYPLNKTESCPKEAPIKCTKGLTNRCCPVGTECVVDGPAWCCPKGMDALECRNSVIEHERCPGDAFVLWTLPATTGGCCTKGWFGYWMDGGFGCLAIGEQKPSKATSATQSTAMPCAAALSQTASSSSLPTTSTKSIASETGAESTSTPTTVPPAAAAADDSNKGTTVGIAVGVSLGVVLLAAIAACVVFFMRWRKRMRQQAGKLEPMAGPQDPPPLGSGMVSQQHTGTATGTTVSGETYGYNTNSYAYYSPSPDKSYGQQHTGEAPLVQANSRTVVQADSAPVHELQ